MTRPVDQDIRKKVEVAVLRHLLMARCFTALTPLERTVVTDRCMGKSIADIAKQYGITKARVQNLEKKAFRLLTDMIFPGENG